MTKQETKLQMELTVKEFYRHYEAHGAFPLPEDYASVKAIVTPVVMLQYTMMSRARQGAFYKQVRTILSGDYRMWRISTPPEADLTPKQFRKRTRPAVENAAEHVVALRQELSHLYERFEIADNEDDWATPEDTDAGPRLAAVESNGEAA